MPGPSGEKAALRGEPSYVWRAGQQRRLDMIIQAAGDRLKGRVLENGCGIGLYLEHLAPLAGELIGLEYDGERARSALLRAPRILNAAGEALPPAVLAAWRAATGTELYEALGMSEGTVKNHVARIFEKLDVNDRTRAAVRGLQSGLL